MLTPGLNSRYRSHEAIRAEMKSIFPRLHSVVIGPGLGRDTHMQNCGQLAIELAREHDIYIIVDADGLWLVQNDPSVVMGYSKCILTPNVVEFGRLCEKLQIERGEGREEQAARNLAKAMKGPTILEKGRVDRITNGDEVLYCDEQGGLKRAGGQGDILSGCLGTFAAWASIYRQQQLKQQSSADVKKQEDWSDIMEIPENRLPLLAAYAAAITTRTCSREGFKRCGRAMLADDLLQEVGPAYAKLVVRTRTLCYRGA